MNKSLLIYVATFLIAIYFSWRYQKKIKNDEYNKDINNVDLKKSKRTNMYYGIMVIFVPVFISSIRWYTGTDFNNYLLRLRVSQNFNLSEFTNITNEPLYGLLNYIANLLFAGRDWSIFFLSSLIIMFFIFLTITYYEKYLSIPLSLFIYFMLYYLLTYNIVRQMIAVSIILFSYRYIMEHKFAKYVIWVIIASLFHKSAIVCIFFYLLSFKKDNGSKYMKYLFYLIICISPVIIGPILQLIENLGFISLYSDRYDIEFNGIGFGFLLDVIPAVVPALIFRKNIRNRNPEFDILINISLLTIPLRMMGYYQYWAIRLMHFSSIVQIILIPILIQSIKSKRERVICYIFFIAMYLIYFIYNFVINNDGEVFPYQSIIPFFNAT